MCHNGLHLTNSGSVVSCLVKSKDLILSLPLTEIEVDESLSPRKERDLSLIDQYVEVLDELPPVSLFKVGKKLYLVDGFHRFYAHSQAHRATIRAIVVGIGSLIEAKDTGDTANLRHGLPLNRAERKEVARRFHDRHPQWSARKLGKIMGCAHTTILGFWQEGCGVGRIHRPGPSAPVLAAAPVAVRSVPANGALHHRGIICPNCGHSFEAAA